MFSFVAMPVWMVLTVACLALVPQLRRWRPHLLALPLSYLGTFVAVSLQPEAVMFWVSAAIAPIIGWYCALLKLSALRPLLRNSRF